MMDTLDGRTAVITGAASGLGRAMAERMAAEGMRLVLADIEADPLDDLGVRLGDGGTEVVTQRTDVSQAGEIDRLAALAFERFGAVHVLCNNAGVVKRARSWELTEDDWRWVLDVDLWSVIHAVRAFVPRMLEQSGRRAHRQHGIDVRPAADPQPGRLQRRQGGGRRPLGGTAARLRRRRCARSACPCSVPGSSPPASRRANATGRPSARSPRRCPPSARTTAGVQPTMDAAEVAGQVVDAIRTNRFWILTHQDYRTVIQQRAAGVGTDARPTAPPIW